MNILEKYHDVSFRNGKFLSDKSYAYDTIYFVTKFLSEYSENGIINLKKWKTFIIEYISGVFNRDIESADIYNYCNEVLDVLIYSKTVEKLGNSKNLLKINDIEVINFITSKMENAYIYLYVLAYYTMKNSGVLELYKDFCNTSDPLAKKQIISQINEILYNLNDSVQSGSDSQWAMQNTEYSINVLNFLNYQPQITRTHNIKQTALRDPQSISRNVKGTKSIGDKNNEYLNHFDFKYVDEMLKDIIVYKGGE